MLIWLKNKKLGYLVYEPDVNNSALCYLSFRAINEYYSEKNNLPKFWDEAGFEILKNIYISLFKEYFSENEITGKILNDVCKEIQRFDKSKMHNNGFCGRGSGIRNLEIVVALVYTNE